MASLGVTPAIVERATRLGRVRGTERLGVEAYRGLRYALPARRFEAAEPFDTPWSGTHDGTSFKAMACQDLNPRAHRMVYGSPPEGEVAEDCLFLNIYAPQLTPAAPRPVIVFIHGGSFTGGGANLYDGTALARGADAVVVCVNYRLGIFAAFDLAWLGTERDGGGQHWLGDQITALRWIRDNIGDYGGDPDLVTIIGESAGAVSVGALCAAPQASGLVHRAVACSTGYPINDPSTDVVGAIARLRRCNRGRAVDYLRAAPAHELMAIQKRGRRVTPNPVSHTPLLPGDPGELIRARGSKAVPLITGYATHEGLMLELLLKHGTGLPSPLPQLLSHLVSRAVAQHAAHGKANVPAYLKRLKTATGSIGFGSRFNDLIWTDGFRRGATEYCEATGGAGSSAWLYVMDIPMRFAGRRIPASHGIDLSLTFGVWDDPAHTVPDFTDTPNAPELGRRWVQMLGHFARNGEPGEALGRWPAYETQSRASLRLDAAGFRVEHDVDAMFRRAVWN
jgi:para-nitrobenzyl esterase